MSVVRTGTGRTARWVTCFAAAALLALPAAAVADPFFTLKTTVVVPGNALNSFDISWVDPDLHAYLLSDRSNKAIDVINTVTKAPSQLAVGAFRGAVAVGSSYPTTCPSNACNGPNGVLSFFNRASGKNEVWAGDGPTTSCPGRQTLATATTACSTVKVIDFNTGAVLHVIPTGGQYRADELCYDAADHLIQIANDSDLPFPYINYIPTEGPNAYKVVKQIQFDGKPGDGPAATNGIEQCKWNARTGLIYLNIPEVNGDGNDVAPGWTVVIDPRTMQIINHFVIPLDACAGPQGMALGPDPEILLGCNAKGPPETPAGCDPTSTCTGGTGPQNTAVIDERNGNVIKVLANQGGNDEVWFNPGNGLYFLAEGQNATAVQLGIASSFPFINTVQDVVVANAATGHAHSVAADPFSGEVYFPIPNNLDAAGNTIANPCGANASQGCIAVYGAQFPPYSQWSQ
jgi:hypothetical protein